MGETHLDNGWWRWKEPPVLCKVLHSQSGRHDHQLQRTAILNNGEREKEGKRGGGGGGGGGRGGGGEGKSGKGQREEGEREGKGGGR